MRKIYVLWVIAIAALAYASLYYDKIETIFYGITDSKELVISEDRSVTIDSVFVVSGQSVKKGELLITLSSKQLDMNISQKQYKLQELKVKKAAGSNDVKSRIIQLRQEKMAKLNDVDQEIRQLNDQYEKNKKFASQLKSLNINADQTTKSEILKQVENLKQDRKFITKSYSLKISQLQGAIKRGEDPNTVLISNIEEELKELQNQKNNLKIFSMIDGVIGSVNYRANSTIPPYAPIVTLSHKSPSYIKGFIHESIYNKVKEGDKVIINSTAQNYAIEGEVVGLGFRIVEFPERLRKHVDIKIWGREAVIRIPEKNNFLLGEKVSVAVKPVKTKQIIITPAAK